VIAKAKVKFGKSVQQRARKADLNWKLKISNNSQKFTVSKKCCKSGRCDLQLAHGCYFSFRAFTVLWPHNI